MPEEAIQKKEGKITVYIQREDVLATVSTLARTVESLARVLTQTPQVNITGCHIQGGDPAIEIQDMRKELMREEEEEVE